jgi:hypothetical protein
LGVHSVDLEMKNAKRSRGLTSSRAKVKTVPGQRQRKPKKSLTPKYEEILTDAEWQKITASSPLPVNARDEINFAIGHYRMEVSVNRTRLTTKRLVSQARGHIKKILEKSGKLQGDSVFFDAGQPRLRGGAVSPTPGEFKELVNAVLPLDRVLEEAQRRMKMKRGRKSSRPLEKLIQLLVWVQADATEKFVKRSIKTGISQRPTNAFITLCVGVADPKVPASLIESTLTKAIKEHWFAREHFDFDTATGRPVD